MGARLGTTLQCIFAGEVGGTGGERLLKAIDTEDGGTGATICVPDSVHEVRRDDRVMAKHLARSYIATFVQRVPLEERR